MVAGVDALDKKSILATKMSSRSRVLGRVGLRQVLNLDSHLVPGDLFSLSGTITAVQQ